MIGIITLALILFIIYALCAMAYHGAIVYCGRKERLRKRLEKKQREEWEKYVEKWNGELEDPFDVGCYRVTVEWEF